MTTSKVAQTKEQVSGVCTSCGYKASWQEWLDQDALLESIQNGEFTDGCDCGTCWCGGDIVGRVVFDGV